MTLLTPSRFSVASLVCAIFLLFSVWALWPSSTLVHAPVPHNPHEKPQLAVPTHSDSRPSSAISSPEISSPEEPSPFPESTSPQHSSEPGSVAKACRTLPGASDTVIVVKTGASEIYEKLPIHLFTLLECVPNFLIVSDLEQDIGSFHVHDVLSSVSPGIQKGQPEFESYKSLAKLYQNNQDLSTLKGEQAWNLDKWKFLPMLEKAYDAFSDKKWFLFVEADTAVLWSNLLMWLSRLDPEEPLYAGSQNSQGGYTFAHGGSGILMSHAAVAKFADAYPQKKTTWEHDVQEMCCGDVTLAKVLLDLGIKMTPAFPLIQGEAPMTVDWNERHMCAPSVTWHHVNARDIDTLWGYQNKWVEQHGRQDPLLFHHLFTHYFEDYVQDRREMWDNISEDFKYTSSMKTSGEWEGLSEVQKSSMNSFEDCRKACVEKEECFQFRHKKDECVLGSNIRVGRKVESEAPEDKVTSGWMKNRITAFRDSFDKCKGNWGFDQ